jgi:hypothetical protein
VLAAVESWTGERPLACPWRAFYDPLVARVTHIYSAYKRGALAMVEPDASHRLVEGLMHFDRALDAVEYHQIKEEQANAARAAEAR